MPDNREVIEGWADEMEKQGLTIVVALAVGDSHKEDRSTVAICALPHLKPEQVLKLLKHSVSMMAKKGND